MICICPHYVYQTCLQQWAPDVRDLVRSGYWPASANACTMLNSFQELKLISPGFSRQAFAKMLEHHTLCRKSKYDISNTIYYAHQYYQQIIFIYFDYLKNVFSYSDILSSLDRSTGMPSRGAFLSLPTPPLRKTSYAVIPLSPALPAHL